MTIESYLLFVAASIILVLVPGPDMAYMLARCVTQGRKAGVLAALGINLGAYVHLAASVTGLSAILMTSTAAYSVVKWIGAAYLVYLGVTALLTKSVSALAATGAVKTQSGAKIFWQGFLSDALNPKVAMFYLAFLPQFVHAQSENPTAQLLLLGLTVNVIALPINLALVFLSTSFTRAIRHNNAVAIVLQKAMGLMFVGLGLRLVSEKS